MTGPRPSAPIPWPRRRLGHDPFEGTDIDRLHVFVPAIMSVGLIFSIATLVRDFVRWGGSQARERRTALEATTVLSRLLDEGRPEPRSLGILSRPSYLFSALVLVGAATYVAIGSTANFLRDGGYVRDIGWLLAVSLALSTILGFLGAVSLAVFRSWPHPPPWTMGPLRTVPLTSAPDQAGRGPSWGLGVAVALSALATGLLTLMVASGRSFVDEIDQPIAQWFVEAEWIERLSAVDPYGRTIFSIAFVVVIGLSVFRCRVMALVYPVAFLTSWISSAALRELVERPRPTGIGDVESFPSGHMVQAVFIAGLVPLAIEVLVDRRLAIISRVVLGGGVVATALHRIHRQDHYPLDTLAGFTLGLTVVLGTYWVLEHQPWHRRCSSCPWSGHPADIPWGLGLIKMSPTAVRQTRLFGAGLAIAAAAALAVLTVTVGLPADPEGAGLGSAIAGPVQLALAALMGIAGLLAMRWPAPAAVLMAIAAFGLGLVASIEYRPLLTVGLAVLLIVPAVITWLAWQPTETLASIALLAVVTTGGLTATAIGANTTYDHFFGPTHPSSTAADPDFAEAAWLWLGAAGPRSVTVVAGGLDPATDVALRYGPAAAVGDDQPAGALRGVVPGRVGDDGVARFVIDGLEPDTAYDYRVARVDDQGSDPDSSFRTPADGPQDLVIVAASCARTGSNGAVFDAMVAEQPDLYLALGDLHYGNLESTYPADHLALYGLALRQPGQANLFSSTPTAYVWDDHDFGPNDADSGSPSRPAVSEAYRRAVPHAGVDPDPEASIAQAFTVGRVRFVLSDTRSQRTGDTMLGQDQLDWLIDELITASESHALVVWANPTPWISANGVDDWGAYETERRTIADALAAAGVDDLIMVSGDAHMVAIDDGTNSGYATDGSPGFPVLHAAALDRPGSVKGGPYSHGAFPGPGQYGTIEIDDDGGPSIDVTLTGRTWDGRDLVTLTLTVDV